jgi:3-oxosteroid 1-dehydrogenase
MRPTNLSWTLSNKGDTGEVLGMAMDLGAATNNMDLSWWNSVSLKPDGGIAGNVMDISKPHAIMVDQSGQRYVNESTSYVAVGLAMYERDKTVPAIPSWCVLDSQHRDHYLFSGAKPGAPPQEWLDSGYMIKAESLDELAAKCGIDAEGLKATVERFNGFARKGVDEDFKRSFSRYDQFFGDPTNKPAPNLGTLEKAPFYAVKMFPGDVGTAGGIVADEYARVVKEDGSIIQNLYATGNATAPVVGRSYPGAGASIASSAVFGFIAAKHAVGANG